MDPAIVEKIKKRNWMDIELYEMAQARFEREFAEVGKFLIQRESHSVES
jgi:hypothetical protein